MKPILIILLIAAVAWGGSIAPEHKALERELLDIHSHIFESQNLAGYKRNDVRSVETSPSNNETEKEVKII